MTTWTIAFETWLIDFSLHSTLLLVITASATLLMKQPVQRLALAWSTVGGLGVLAILCAIPGWPRFEIASPLQQQTAAQPAVATHRVERRSFEPVQVDATIVDLETTIEGETIAESSPGQSHATDRTSGPPIVPSADDRGKRPAGIAPTPVDSWHRLSFLKRHWIATLFTIGMIPIAFWLCWGAHRAHVLCRHAVAAPAPLQRQLERVVGTEGGCPRLLISRQIHSPVALGTFRPKIILPEKFVEPDQQALLPPLLMHEWTHIRNRDLWMLGIDRWLLLVLFANPLYWWFRRRTRDDQEALADAAAAGCTTRERYAEQLLAWAREISAEVRRPMSSTVGIWERPSRLSRRIARLLDKQRPTDMSCNHRVKLSTMATLAALVLLLSVLTARQVPPASADERGSADERVALRIGSTDSDKANRSVPVRLGSPRLQAGGIVSEVAFAPDGKLVASWGQGPIKIWDTSTGILVRKLVGHTEVRAGGGQCVAFSPNGRLLASGGCDWTVRIWDMETGEQIHLLRAHRYGLLGRTVPIQVAFTPNGDRLVSAGHEGVVQVWDTATGRKVMEIDGPTDATSSTSQSAHLVVALDVSPDGRTVAVFEPNRIRLLDLSGEKSPKEAPAEFGYARDLKFSPDGKLLAWCGTSPGQGHGIVLWNLATDAKSRLPGHAEHRTYGIDFSPDGGRLASSGYGNTIKLWDVETGRELWTAKGHTAIPWCVAFSKDGTTIASGASDGSVRLWEANGGKEKLPNLGAELGTVIGMSVPQDSQTVLVAYENRFIRHWDLNGQLKRSFPIEGRSLHRRGSAAFSRDGSLAAIGCDATIDVWDVHTGKRLWSKDELKQAEEFKLDSPITTGVVFSNDGKRLISKTADSEDPWRSHTAIRVWDVESGKLLSQINIPRRVSDLPAIGPDGESVALNTDDSWDRTKRTTKRTTDDVRIEFYDMSSGTLLREFKSPDSFGSSFALSPDGKMFAAGTSRSRIRFWDTRTGELLFTLQGPHDGGGLTEIVFSPDGSHISGSSSFENHATIVWRIADGRLIHLFPVRTRSLVYSPDGRKLLAGQDDGTLLVWDLETAFSTWPTNGNFTDHEIQSRWLQLAYGRDTSRGNRGNAERVNAVIEAGDQAVAFLENVLPAQDLGSQDRLRARELVAPLANPDPEIRIRSARSLERFGDETWMILTDMNVAHEPASVVKREALEAVLTQGMQYRRDDTVYKALRQIATPRARRLLRKLADELDESSENETRKWMAKRTIENLEKLKIRGSN